MLLCLGQENDFLEELKSLNQNQDLFKLPAFKAIQIGNLQKQKPFKILIYG